MNRETQKRSELTRIPADYLENIGQITERELPPIEQPTDEPFPIGETLFYDGEDAPVYETDIF